MEKNTEPDNTVQRASGMLHLEHIKLHIGDSLQLQFQPESNPARCTVTLIGYLADQGIIVTTPMLNGIEMMIREGQVFIVRLLCGKSAYAFTAEATKVSNTPFSHMFLTYPKEVRGLVLRGSSRAPANIACHATAGGDKGYACVARDMSLGGAQISAHSKIGEIGGKFSLNFNVHFNRTDHKLLLNCTIRSVNITPSPTGESPLFLHGISFENVSAQDTLLISALLYQNLVNDGS